MCIIDNAPNKSGQQMLEFLIGCLPYDMGDKVENICLTAAACLPQTTLQDHRQELGPELSLRYWIENTPWGLSIRGNRIKLYTQYILDCWILK